DGDGVMMLDPDTGNLKDRVRVAEVNGYWKWMALQDGVLYALVGKQPDPPETTVVRSQIGHWSWRELSNGYYTPRVTWGFGTTLLAYNIKKDKLLWTHNEAKPVDSRAMTMGGGHVYLYGPDSHLRCLVAKTGKIEWTNDDPKLREMIEQKPTKRLESTPGWRSTCFALYTPKGLFYEAQTRNFVVAVSLKDGSYMWRRQKTTNNPNMLYLEGDLLVGIGEGPVREKGNVLVLDPLTGETKEDLGFRKRSCVRVTATPDSLFCRGWREGVTRYDRINKKVMFNSAFRPACNDGIIGANGLLYLGPWACDCNLSLMGRVALCSAGDFKFDRIATEAERLEVGKGDTLNVVPLEVSQNDWPTYRANIARNASTRVEVPTNAKKINQAWHYSPVSKSLPTIPTAAGGLIFLGDNHGMVKAIDAADGKLKWSYATAGPIMQPPTIWNGRAYVGSGDGYIYALEAATGRLLWRFRAAPAQRKIMVYGSLISAWPVNSGVMVKDGIAYAAAGIIDYDGTYVYALDAVTGKIKWQNCSSGHLNKELRKGVSAQGCMTVLADRLWMCGGNIISPAAYDLKTGEYLSGDPGNGSVNMQTNRGEDIGVFKDQYIIHGGRLRYSSRRDVVNPGKFYLQKLKPDGTFVGPRMFQLGKVAPAWNDKKILLVKERHALPVLCDAGKMEEHYVAKPKQKRPPRNWEVHWWNNPENKLWSADWMANHEAVSLALAKNIPVVVCKWDVPRQLTNRWLLCALHPKKGVRMWQKNLPSPALMGGLLIDRDGRIVVALQDGGVMCFAGAPDQKVAQQQASRN
ncbi:MAG: outer membrane protein assembly factor BamB family protein, partial [Planctomycetota bacterium]